MKKTFYIITGLGERPNLQRYQNLKKVAQKKGYSVVIYQIDLNKLPSEQVFKKVEKNSTIFGFSIGALLARLIAQEYKVEKLILASSTPVYGLKDKKYKKALIEVLGKDFTNDLSKKIKSKNKAKKTVVLYGDREEEKSDILIKNTGHFLTKNYIKVIEELL